MLQQQKGASRNTEKSAELIRTAADRTWWMGTSYHLRERTSKPGLAQPGHAKPDLGNEEPAQSGFMGGQSLPRDQMTTHVLARKARAGK